MVLVSDSMLIVTNRLSTKDRETYHEVCHWRTRTNNEPNEVMTMSSSKQESMYRVTYENRELDEVKQDRVYADSYKAAYIRAAERMPEHGIWTIKLR